MVGCPPVIFETDSLLLTNAVRQKSSPMLELLGCVVGVSAEGERKFVNSQTVCELPGKKKVSINH